MTVKQKPIYLDYMATTPLDPRILPHIKACLTKEGIFGNAASQHYYGFAAHELVDKARAQVAELIGAEPNEIVWTSGATEATNLAIKGACQFYQRKGKHIITFATEHKATLQTCHYLGRCGFELTVLDPQPNGLIDFEKFAAALRPDTILVSVMHVNNETGVIQDIPAISKLLQERGILLHVDAAQSAGKLPIAVREWKVDLMSLSAHKMYGPKGIGALYVRREPRLHLEPQIHGGGQEQSLRGGTLATHQIVGMGKAAEIALQQMDSDYQHIKELSELFLKKLQSLEGVSLHGSEQHRYLGCFNLRFADVDNESLMLSLSDIAVSASSACNAASGEMSYVLKAMQIPLQHANQSLRISIGRFTTEAEVEFAAAHIKQEVQRLREISPLWRLPQEA